MKKYRYIGKVLENKFIEEDIYRMTVYSKEGFKDSKAGQFINLYPNDSSTLLPRPISICSIKNDEVKLVYKIVGKGTKVLASYQQGDEISISSSLGNGFHIEESLRSNVVVLAGGGVGTAPLVGLAEYLRAAKPCTQIIAVLGFQQNPFLIEEFQDVCDQVFISTETGRTGFQGNVVQLIREMGINGDLFMACGPKPMLKALSDYCLDKHIPIQVMLEERMGCGYGACLGCSCKVKQNVEKEQVIVNKKVCKDGPVFFGNEVIWDEK